MTANTPVDLTHKVLSLRMYLRTKVYPEHQQEFQENIYTNIPDVSTMQVSFDMTEYTIKLKSVPYDDSSIYYIWAESCIITFLQYVYNQSIIENDQYLDQKTKDEYIEMISDIINLGSSSPYVKLLVEIRVVKTDTQYKFFTIRV
jgi:hypothetical protein